MTKTIALCLTGLLLLTLAACGAPAGNTASPAPTAESSSVPEPSSAVNQPEPSQSGAPQSESPESSGTDNSESKILVAYFSSAGNIETDKEVRGNIGNGNTKTLAEMIVAKAGGDMFFIETVEKYPANYNDAIGLAMQELRVNSRPALASHVENMDEYDVIFLGYPNWWGTIPMPILTFIEEYDFAGKTVIPFCTYEDSGIGRSVQDLGKALPNATLLQEYSVSEHDLPDAEEAIELWLTELNLPK